MRDFIILVIEMLGYALIIGFFLTILNYFFDWHLGVYNVEMPDDPVAGLAVLAGGLFFSGLGYILNKKYPPQKSPE